MDAYAILRRNKTSIVETLCADYRLILDKAYQKMLITLEDHDNLFSLEDQVLALVDKIIEKGEKNCLAFLKLLQTDEIQETFPELKNILEDEQYELKSQPTGLCLILNNKDFGDGDVRRGTDKDAERLGEVFSWLGFRVLMCKDQTKNQMERVLKCFASQRGLSQLQEFQVQEWTGSRFTDLLEAPQHGNAFICCLLSYGTKGVVLGVDGKPLRIKEITRTFMATPQSPLTAKPKVFLIEASQGVKKQPGVVSDVQVDYFPLTRQAADSHTKFIPQEADFLVHSSTVEDHDAIRDPEVGSWFIQSVCNQLIVGCQRNEDIEVILRRVNKEVSVKECVLRGAPTTQMPDIWHTLRKRLVLNPHHN